MLLLFVHGVACAGEDWDAQRRALEAHHEIVTPDLPGHGKTPGTVRDATMANLAAHVANRLTQPTVLVGHSMGCRVVLAAARGAPEHVRGIVLIDGSRAGSGDPDEARRAIGAQLAAAGGYAGFIRAFFAAMIVNPLPRGEELIARALRLDAGFGEALILDVVRWDAAELDGALGAVRVPLMAIQSTTMNAERQRVALRAGESSPWLDLIRSRVPGARIEVLPGVGHFCQIEAAGEVTRLIAEFTAGVPGAV